MKQGFIYILFFIFPFVLSAQQDAIQKIEEVKIYSPFSKNDQVGYSINILSDSILKENTQDLIKLLQKNANLYFKEQGNGMVASIAMRGTGASHTAVYWNGIPVNSSLNGQTDFNTIHPSLYNSITIRKGGGSVFLGSGAIGGAIDLTNELAFNNKINGVINTGIGSYQTYTIRSTFGYGSDKFAIEVGFSGIDSKNNYPYLGTDLSNQNGEIQNYAINLGFGYQLASKHHIFYKSLLSKSDRNTSRTLTSTSNANLLYTDNNHLLEWVFDNNNFNGSFKAAYSNESYLYLFDKDYPDNFSDNSSEKWIANYTASLELNNAVHLVFGTNYKFLTGTGTDLAVQSQQDFSIFSGITHHVSPKFDYNLSLRKEWSDTYTIPFLFSLSSQFQWNKHFKTGINVSKNFRNPTLNDLFWEPGGNLNLKPENSFNFEVNSEWKKNNLKTTTAVFAIRSSDLIQWQPIFAYVWQPFNIQEVFIYGFEYSLKYLKVFNKHKITGNIQYSYTVSKDSNMDKQLLYVPYHLANLNLDYLYKKWQISYNLSYNGKVYTTTSNTEFVPGFYLSDIQVSKSFSQKKFKLSLTVNNLFNKKYQIVANRPMPNINYQLNLLFKF